MRPRWSHLRVNIIFLGYYIKSTEDATRNEMDRR